MSLTEPPGRPVRRAGFGYHFASMNVTNESPEFVALHAIRVGGLHAEMPANADELSAGGLIFVTPAGCMLTDEGQQRHAELLDSHRTTVDLDAVGALYQRFLAVNQSAKTKCADWQRLADDDEDGRFMIASDLQDILERVSATLTRTATHLPRFGGYPARLQIALDRVFEGQNEFLTSPRVASFHNVWMECHEDYLLTLGISREEEGSY